MFILLFYFNAIFSLFVEGEKGSPGDKGGQGEKGQQGQKGMPGTCDTQAVHIAKRFIPSAKKKGVYVI